MTALTEAQEGLYDDLRRLAGLLLKGCAWTRDEDSSWYVGRDTEGNQVAEASPKQAQRRVKAQVRVLGWRAGHPVQITFKGDLARVLIDELVDGGPSSTALKPALDIASFTDEVFECGIRVLKRCGRRTTHAFVVGRQWLPDLADGRRFGPTRAELSTMAIARSWAPNGQFDLAARMSGTIVFRPMGSSMTVTGHGILEPFAELGHDLDPEFGGANWL